MSWEAWLVIGVLGVILLGYLVGAYFAQRGVTERIKILREERDRP